MYKYSKKYSILEYEDKIKIDIQISKILKTIAIKIVKIIYLKT